ncbi:MAG: alanine--tRNA ligase [Leptospiraceae bacterium]|nr:alanine--tRNA ligase [Leptospiraceae bacterium]NUM41930.1 alanine--tRNA ligase [Leptospiraceae bacterium]
MVYSVKEIRQAFLEFFKSKGHTIVQSSSLVPVGDPTLLFTTAGMVQFKPYFTGAVDLPFTRAASSQKCLRTTDLENVGKTERHCTFFEMLGNFSFGDYFKKEAIDFSYEFSTKILGFPHEKIWITVYLDDDEAIEIWKKKGIPQEKIVKLGKKDNFWGPAGESGACGPCSELYLDRGIEKAGPNCKNNLDCKPGCDCDRFLEFWNIVFNQFDQDSSGILHPLKQTGIDTGSGLERVALLIQNVDSVYDTDELKRIISFIENKIQLKYDSLNAPSFRVLTDHSRAIAFAISDGIYPDKAGRGYVIRRLIRRGVLFGKKIGIDEPFIYKIIPEIISIYSDEYPELKNKKNEIEKIVQSEEILFWNTLELGLDHLENILEKYSEKKEKVFSGIDSFRLYGTYGFPPEMTKEIVLERGLEFDENGFNEELEKDRTTSRETWKGKKESLLSRIEEKIPETNFTGYTETKSGSEISFLFANGVKVNTLESGQEGVIITRATPFYAESGGQLGDTGYIRGKNSTFQVTDTQKENDVYFHIGIVLSGKFSEKEIVELEIDEVRRKNLSKHHSGTHLLNGALRKILGSHVMQKASLVCPDYLRFDFSHSKALEETEIEKIEETVNISIKNSILVNTKVLPIEEAKKTNAVSVFDEKYGDQVRVVGMGEDSIEFCGGVHVHNTSEIEYFSILKESSPGAGNRRIEAICGNFVIEYFQKIFQELTQKIQTYNLEAKDVYGETSGKLIEFPIPTPEKISKQFSENDPKTISEMRKIKREAETELNSKNLILIKEKKKKSISEFEKKSDTSSEILENATHIKDIVLVVKVFENENLDFLKILGDKLKEKEKKILILFANITTDGVTFLFMTNKITTEEGIHCGDLMKKACQLTSGRGGGKADMAQGGGKDSSSIPSTLDEIVNEVKIKLGA